MISIVHSYKSVDLKCLFKYAIYNVDSPIIIMNTILSTYVISNNQVLWLFDRMYHPISYRSKWLYSFIIIGLRTLYIACLKRHLDDWSNAWFISLWFRFVAIECRLSDRYEPYSLLFLLCGHYILPVWKNGQSIN